MQLKMEFYVYLLETSCLGYITFYLVLILCLLLETTCCSRTDELLVERFH